MPNQEKSLGKKRGRPAIGPGVQINAVFRPETVDAIDAWAARQGELELKRPEAVRRLTELGLAAQPDHESK